MKPTMRFVRWGIGFLLLAGFASPALWAEELSHARIVRLSFTEGVVTIQRPDVADEWANAPANTPIQEGFKLATGEGGFAEVEFENSSTARIGQNSLLEFTQLALLPSGGKLNRMALHQGYATFNTVAEGEDSYEVTAGTATLTPSGKTRFRVDFDEGMVQVKVFKGSVEVMSPEGTGTLSKNTVLEIRPGSEEPFLTSQGITKDAWDQWVEERESRVELVRHQSGPSLYSANVGDLMWGVMDLTYYGNWVSMPGYGYGWAPNVGMGWSPYTSGRWCFYPNMGFTWISYEPWGWLPYHYGAWIFDPGLGWMWIPTGMGAWSPAMVNWYQGPGWVGWAPMSPGGLSNCPRSAGCIAVAPEDTFRHGRPIDPAAIRWTGLGAGQSVAQPDIQPDRTAMLPGSSRIADRFSGRGTQADPTRGQTSRPTIAGAAGGTIPTSSSAARPIENRPGIVFNPNERRFENNPAATIPGVAPEATSATRSAFSGSGARAQAARPAPQSNYPNTAWEGNSRGASGSDRGAGQRGAASQSSSWGGDNVMQSGSSGSRGAWGSRDNQSTASGIRSTSSSPSGGGGRTAPPSNSSASSGSSRSTGGNSGGWGGGSSAGGGHSSGGIAGGGGSSGGWGGGGGSHAGGGGGSQSSGTARH